MKRKTKPIKPVTLRQALRHLGEDHASLRTSITSCLDAHFAQLSELTDKVENLDLKVTQLKNTPLSVVREVEGLIEKLNKMAHAQGDDVDNIFPDIRRQFDAMAEAVNKISAYAKAIEESGKGLRDLTHKRIRRLEKASPTDPKLLAKLKHRIKRMEQKL